MLHPVGRELAWANRRLLAARQGWPEGALEACETIERDQPAWSITWRTATPGWADAWSSQAAQPAGYYATRYEAPRVELYAASPDELAAAITAWCPPQQWRPSILPTHRGG